MRTIAAFLALAACSLAATARADRVIAPTDVLRAGHLELGVSFNAFQAQDHLRKPGYYADNEYGELQIQPRIHYWPIRGLSIAVSQPFTVDRSFSSGGMDVPPTHERGRGDLFVGVRYVHRGSRRLSGLAVGAGVYSWLPTGEEGFSSEKPNGRIELLGAVELGGCWEGFVTPQYVLQDDHGDRVALTGGATCRARRWTAVGALTVAHNLRTDAERQAYQTYAGALKLGYELRRDWLVWVEGVVQGNTSHGIGDGVFSEGSLLVGSVGLEVLFAGLR